MNYFFITGSSRGLGKALASTLLKEEMNFVTGISRHCSISHPNYKHIILDLANPAQVLRFLPDIFPSLQAADKIVLINNASVLGKAAYLGNTDSQAILDSLQVNIASPAILINEFIRKYEKQDAEKIILNITSGAGKRAVDGWASYCAAKAALNMMSDVMAEEEKIRQRGFRIFSAAPGIVDTYMQAEIRNSDVENFSALEKFRAYKEEGALADPEYVAGKLIYVLNNPGSFPGTQISVRDF
ncbi:MAG: SDR family NAD(P)-dependent oxidoreductase [Cytophagaceae bacterium]